MGKLQRGLTGSTATAKGEASVTTLMRCLTSRIVVLGSLLFAAPPALACIPVPTHMSDYLGYDLPSAPKMVFSGTVLSVREWRSPDGSIEQLADVLVHDWFSAPRGERVLSVKSGRWFGFGDCGGWDMVMLTGQAWLVAGTVVDGTVQPDHQLSKALRNPSDARSELLSLVDYERLAALTREDRIYAALAAYFRDQWPKAELSQFAIPQGPIDRRAIRTRDVWVDLYVDDLCVQSGWAHIAVGGTDVVQTFMSSAVIRSRRESLIRDLPMAFGPRIASLAEQVCGDF